MSKQPRALQISATLTLVVSALCGGFLFLTGSHIPKYVILFLCLITCCLSYCNNHNTFKSVFQPFKDFLLPWCPWYFSVIVLMLFFQGVPEGKEFFNALLIMSCIFIALYSIDIKREAVIVCLALTLFLSTLAIDIQMLTVGFMGADVIGTNKNKVLGITSALTVSCLGSLLLGNNDYSKKTKILIVISSLTSFAAIILAEVRTAIIPFLTLIPLICYTKRKNKVAISVSIAFALVLVSLSFLTGRMQEGLADLQAYSSGNSNSSWGIRLELWKLALRAFWDAPIFGWGADAFNSMMSAGHTFAVKEFRVLHFHNDFLNALTAGGLFEVICWLTTIVLLFRKSLKDPASLCLLIGILSVGITERYWFHRITLFAFVTIWALLYISRPKPTSQQTPNL